MFPKVWYDKFRWNMKICIYIINSYINFTGYLPFIAMYSGVPFVIVIQSFLLKINTANPTYYVTLFN